MVSRQKINSTEPISCVACYEMINASATTCPHCGASQSLYRFKALGLALRWLGGVVTIISLVIGGITLNQFYQEWHERQMATAEMVDAADWLIKTENYQQAWQMYEQAATLSPSSVLVRDGRYKLALLWLKNFQTERKLLATTLKEISEILYRGLPSADKEQAAAILAHIGYVHVIRKLHGLPQLVDADKLFELALNTNANNALANSMYARWLLLKKPMTQQRLLRANALFKLALTSGKDQEFIQRIQLVSLVNYTYGYDSDIEFAALQSLLQALTEIRARDQKPPAPHIRDKILAGYGRMGKAEHVEKLVMSLPAESHLQTYQWLRQDIAEDRELMKGQSSYIIARLNEQIGNTALAIHQYKTLLSQQTRKEVERLVNQAIKRLTGQLPLRAQIRNYQTDIVDHSNPIPFHLDTFKHFAITERSQNFLQALDYFSRWVVSSSTPLADLKAHLPDAIERTYSAIQEGDKIQKMNAYTTGFSRWHHDNARQNYIDLVLLHCQTLQKNQQEEKNIAQLSDLLKRVSTFEESSLFDWLASAAIIEFSLAKSYSQVSIKTNSTDDKEQAILHLINAVKHGVTEHKQISWQNIKSKDFAVLRNDPRYQKLIRGR